MIDKNLSSDSQEVTTVYCRKCMKKLLKGSFYERTDMGIVDSNGYMSVCKDCIQKLYDEFFEKTQNMEKTIHKLCMMLNIKYSNEAVSSVKAHINTLQENGKTARQIFGIYKAKLIATRKNMDKSIEEDGSYEDVGVIYTTPTAQIKEAPIPKDLIDFWGEDIKSKDIQFLESQYANFKNTHKADTYAEIVLLKEVCYTMLKIKNMRASEDDTTDAVKELQTLMKTLAVSPNSNSSSSPTKGSEAFGVWIQDIEKQEPAQWLKTDPRGDMYRDVGNVEEYFMKYFVRPLKNFITGSKDFNVEDGKEDQNEDTISFDVDDGEV